MGIHIVSNYNNCMSDVRNVTAHHVSCLLLWCIWKHSELHRHYQMWHMDVAWTPTTILFSILSTLLSLSHTFLFIFLPSSHHEQHKYSEGMNLPQHCVALDNAEFFYFYTVKQQFDKGKKYIYYEQISLTYKYRRFNILCLWFRAS